MALLPSRVLLRGGHVYSPAAPFATAMVVVDGVVAWVGEEDAARGHAGDVDEVVALEGRLVTPGFVDAHVHLAQTGFSLQSVSLASAATVTEALDALATAAASHTESVLFAHGWDESRWPEDRAPTASEVDRAVGDAVAYVGRVDGHSAVVSSALLARRPEITALEGWTPDGRVERSAHHAARQVVDALRTPGDRAAAITVALRQAASRGLTSVHEVNAPHIAPYDDFATIETVTAEHQLPEVVAYWGQLFAGDTPDDRLLGYAGDLNMDGALGSRTAALHAPYSDADTAGHLYLHADAVRDHVVACTRLDRQAGFHVIGDRAMREVIAGFRAAAGTVGVDQLVAARHRLEHVEMPDDDAITAMAELGLVASVQPAFDAAWGAVGGLYEQRLGADRAEAMNPFGRMHRAGVTLAFGSDSPVTPLDPWGAVRAAACHHRESERLTVRAAFDAHTRGGHRARRRDDGGMLVPGAPASYAVWDVGSDLPVQTPDNRVTAGSNDARAGVPPLPDLGVGATLPVCAQTVAAGRVLYTSESGPPPTRQGGR